MKTVLISTLMAASVAGAAVTTPAIPHSNTATTVDVLDSMTRSGNSSGAFCYAIEDGTVNGFNVDKPVRIASVMKLLTTFWVVEKLGPAHRFNTRIYIQPSTGEMHMEGSRDPFLDRQRMFMLLGDLNKLGFKHFNLVTIDDKVHFDIQALDFTRNHKYAETEARAGLSLADDNVAENLAGMFNTAGWKKDRLDLYKALVKHSVSPKLPSSVSLSVDKVDIVPSNPLAGKPGVITFDIKSAPVKMYLREMNIMSINPVADELFAAMGGADEFRTFMKSQMKMSTEFDGVYTGSGLPTHGVRHDTTVACSTVVRLIRQLDNDLETKYKSDLSEVMMISGTDVQGATFKESSRSLIVKTGTLTAPGAQAKNLAGALESQGGEVYFGIFLQGKKANSGNVRSALTKMMMNFRATRSQAGALNFDPLDVDMQMKQVVAVARP